MHPHDPYAHPFQNQAGMWHPGKNGRPGDRLRFVQHPWELLSSMNFADVRGRMGGWRLRYWLPVNGILVGAFLPQWR
jgi:hypothetical protein